MRRNQHEIMRSNQLITRRSLIFGGLQLGFVGLLGWRMRQMQVEEADKYRLLADENRINIRLVPPARGVIFDREGRVLAENEKNHRIVIVREDAGNVETVVARLRQLIDIDEEELQQNLAQMRNLSPFVPVTLADKRSWQDIATIEVNAPALPGISANIGLTRQYPAGSDFAHIIGYVQVVRQENIDASGDNDPLLRIPKFQYGQTGIENKMERPLRGKAGTKRVEVNAAGRVMRTLDTSPSTPGANLQLTIDEDLQQFTQARLSLTESASAVVMDIDSGDLLSVGNWPAFDPNQFVRGISVSAFEALHNKFRPLSNKAVQGGYPPASTFKMLVALSALVHGEITPDETIQCSGFTEVFGRRFHCWSRGGHGWMNLNSSLQQSCDVYYYELAQRVGIERIAETARQFGIGQSFDIELSAVISGLMPTKDWKKRRHNQDWVVGDSLNASIGQGFVLASPLQLAVMTARLATGTDISPRLIKTVDGIAQPIIGGQSLGFNENHMRMLRKGMYDVINTRKGTAFSSRSVSSETRIAGKTGTAQVVAISAEERRNGVVSNEDRPWEKRDHALFVGFAPFEAPKVAVSVVVEHGGGGSAAAAPIARDLLLCALEGEMPDLANYPNAQRGRIRQMQETIEERRQKRADQDSQA